MKQLLNTLYVMTPNAYLASSGNNVKIILEKEVVAQLPLQNFESIVTSSYSGVSPALMRKCLDQGISLTFLSEFGQLKGQVTGKITGNVFLRKTQYFNSENEQASLLIAKNFILGKVYNHRWIIERFTRDHPLQINFQEFKSVSERLASGLADIENASTLEQLRGIEGNLASEYFSLFDQMIINQKSDFQYNGRSRRPPMDNVNALLSFAYSLLANECAVALTANGLDSYIGFLHSDRPGRQSLALDLMEELRGVMADRFVLKLINKNEIHGRDFIRKEDGAVLLKDDSRKLFLSKWQDSKKQKIVHPFLKEKIEWGLVPFVQAQLLARYLRGDLDGYPPFFWK